MPGPFSMALRAKVDFFTNVAIALEHGHILKAHALRYDEWRLEAVVVRVFVGYVFDEQHKQDVVFVLAGIHAPS